MLLWMKSHVEGMRFLTYYLTHYAQRGARGRRRRGRKKAMGIAEIMIPINKAGNTDKSVEVTSEAMQVYGGYGFCADYPVEQMMRDSKITAIYEGTNGIQSMDLTMRKILMNPEQYNYIDPQEDDAGSRATRPRESSTTSTSPWLSAASRNSTKSST